jgi:hypothetical protein
MENANEKSEKVFYESTHVSVTQSRYIAHGKTYAIRNISSVSLHRIGASHAWQIIVLIIGMSLFISREPVGICIGVGIAAGAIFWMAKTKDDYAVRISTNSGEVNSIVGKDKDYIQRIVNALNEAIIFRG